MKYIHCFRFLVQFYVFRDDSVNVVSPPGAAEDGLPGSGGPAGAGPGAAHHGGGGGVPLEGAGREAGPSVPAADGGVRGSAPRQGRRAGQRGERTGGPSVCGIETGRPAGGDVDSYSY